MSFDHFQQSEVIRKKQERAGGEMSNSPMTDKLTDAVDQQNNKGARCAHITVKYQTMQGLGGSTIGWWACTDCLRRFIPEPLQSTVIPAENSMRTDDRDFWERCVLAAVFPDSNTDAAIKVADSLLTSWRKRFDPRDKA